MIRYGYADSPFGPFIVACTEEGICDLQFLGNNKRQVIHELGTRWGVYTPTEADNEMAAQIARQIFQERKTDLPLSLSDTDFRMRVWQELRSIPKGCTVSYASLAARMGMPTATRAVASAVAANPVAVLVPCHRVIHSDGSIGEYHWGADIKKALIEWEQSEV